MRISINTFLSGEQREPLGEFVAGLAQALEERGFAGVWMAEHLVAFPSYDPAYPYPYADNAIPPELMSKMGMIEPLTALAAMAVHSKTLRLASGIAILPQRNPVYFAKQAAAVDLLSNGRFVAGLGVGWSAQEYAVTGTPFEHRGSRMRDYIQVIKSLWTDELSQFDGEYYNLPECILLPKPVQRPHPPIYFGGESAAAMRRVAEFGQGWFGLRLRPDALERNLARLGEMLAEYGRSMADIDIVFSPVDREFDQGVMERYAELGVAEVPVVCFAPSLDEMRRELDRLAREVVEPAAKL